MQFRSLPGRVGYEKARELQLSLVESRAADEIEDTVLFLEHEPVITRGRGLQFTGAPRPRHMPAPAFLPEGMAFAESERGGDLTYHGPGQLVVYPIFKLDGKGFGPNHDVAGFLRKFEQIFIDELAARGLEAEARENATGVWVSGRKIASIGIAVRKWVTYHGIAINIVNDLKPFHLISPCGFAPEVMTRLADLTSVGEDWREKWESSLIRRLGGGCESV
jgi:lipoyl(octanoyl) transferase